MTIGRRLESAIRRVAEADALDRVAEPAAGALRAVIRPGRVEDALSGTPVGHPAHPALVAVPIGAWVVSSVLDLTSTDAHAIGRVQLVGILAAAPTAATGASDWLSTAGPERRVGLVHAGLNSVGLALHVASWVSRRRGRGGRARVLGWTGTAVVAASGWIGGHLAYALGVGVDTTVFQKLPEDWTVVCDETDVPADGVLGVAVDGVPLLLARVGDTVVAYAARCSHRGAPLDEGTRDGTCLTCPWHASVFDLRDGAVVSGPASRPQPALDVEVRDARVHVRRREHRTLRTNPVGS